MNPNQNQQGDILLEKVERLPEGCTLVKRSQHGVILAESAATNNRHFILDRGVNLMRAPDETHFVVNENEADVSLQHSKDHGAVAVVPGIHRVMHVQEQDHLTGMAAPALD